jgi:hypothetical protein
MKIVTFDFDDVLTREDVKLFAKQLIEKNINVWILTRRYDELHKHRYPFRPTNEDLFLIAEEVGIPKYKIRFTCRESKCQYLIGTKVVWHLDNSFKQVSEINSNRDCNTIGIQLDFGGYQTKCNSLLFETG